MNAKRREVRRPSSEALTGALPRAAMAAIWRMGEADVKSVREVLSAEQPLAYTTVLTVLQRLTQQGLLNSRLEGRAGIYTPALSETEYLERVLAQELDLVSNEAGYAVLTAALDRLAANRGD